MVAVMDIFLKRVRSETKYRYCILEVGGPERAGLAGGGALLLRGFHAR